MMACVDINPEAHQVIHDIRQRYLPADCRLGVYGSRARGEASQFSDLDLVVLDVELSLDQLALLKEAFVESDLPYRVDITTWARLSPEFQQLIKPDLVLI